ncbi:hypothetical protein [Dyadobacter sp. CY312]|uniref:hypothetical protein n=1 Tax=Dyadobacter sp. CY312 TaxID=2907303 RepID=UPI001F2DC18E|nr:hypothetical protein [Dyadobacter sp. CY312]MCE7039180.1 hypothetical protein [Dyadobacter sp. CY312]
MTTFKVLSEGKEIATLRDKNQTDEIALSRKLKALYACILNVPDANLSIQVWDGKTILFFV